MKTTTTNLGENMKTKLFTIAILTVALMAPFAQAQLITGTPGSTSATTTLQGDQLPPPPQKFGGVIKETGAAVETWCRSRHRDSHPTAE